jgi:hypothetical protein
LDAKRFLGLGIEEADGNPIQAAQSECFTIFKGARDEQLDELQRRYMHGVNPDQSNPFSIVSVEKPVDKRA